MSPSQRKTQTSNGLIVITTCCLGAQSGASPLKPSEVMRFHVKTDKTAAKHEIGFRHVLFIRIDSASSFFSQKYSYLASLSPSISF